MSSVGHSIHMQPWVSRPCAGRRGRSAKRQIIHLRIRTRHLEVYDAGEEIGLLMFGSRGVEIRAEAESSDTYDREASEGVFRPSSQMSVRRWRAYHLSAGNATDVIRLGLWREALYWIERKPAG